MYIYGEVICKGTLTSGMEITELIALFSTCTSISNRHYIRLEINFSQLFLAAKDEKCMQIYQLYR